MKDKMVSVTKIYGAEKSKFVKTDEIKTTKLTNEERVKETSIGSLIKYSY